MEKTQINGKKLKEAIDYYGSLQKAIESGELKEKALGEDIKKRKEKIEQLKQKKDKLNSQINGLDKKYFSKKKNLELIAKKVGKWERQYELFEGFLAMLLTSPSVDTSLKSLIALLEELDSSGWATAKAADEIRSFFVSKIIGDYLKCFQCKGCGAKFFTNREPKGGIYSKFYMCPSCHTSYTVEPDDSFLKLMVSEQQFDNIITAGDLKEENDILIPLKPFLNVICEVCGKPIKEWDEHNVKLAVEHHLWGHTDCWNGELGRAILFVKSIKD